MSYDEDQPRRRYSTRRDAIEKAIMPALDGGAGYDCEAICDDAFTWRIDRDAAGNELLNTGGFEQTVSDEQFWAIAARRSCD